MKNVLKNLKLNENNISMLLGAAVIVIVGFLVVNYFRNIETGTTIPAENTTSQEAPITLPTKHIVEEGETLWSIAEKYYKSGYNWSDIEKANNLSNASVISKGQELTIPDVDAKTITVVGATPTAVATATDSPIAQATTTPEVVATVSPTPSASPEATATPVAQTETKGGMTSSTATTSDTQTITGDSYTVVHGDNLWTIAMRAYGNGYKWTEIAKANNLDHPGVIHTGNVLQLPR